MTANNNINGTEKIGLNVFGYATAANATNVKKIISENVTTWCFISSALFSSDKQDPP